MIERSPRAPVLRSIALRAMAQGPSYDALASPVRSARSA
jgi:hypothetical protein